MKFTYTMFNGLSHQWKIKKIMPHNVNSQYYPCICNNSIIATFLHLIFYHNISTAVATVSQNGKYKVLTEELKWTMMHENNTATDEHRLRSTWSA